MEVHEESEGDPGVDEGTPGAEVLDSNDDVDECKKLVDRTMNCVPD